MKIWQLGPIATIFDTNSLDFTLYTSGIYDDIYCMSYPRFHGVLVVGFGVEKGIRYWIVRNNWGPYCGEDWYIRMARDGYECGITKDSQLLIA